MNTSGKYNGGGQTIFNLNKLVNPKHDEKFSPNLYKWLTYQNRIFTNIFFCPETKIFYIGLRDENNIWMGAKLIAVFCYGNKAERFSYTKSITEKFIDYTDWFWKEYLQIGRQIYYSDGYWQIKEPTK